MSVRNISSALGSGKGTPDYTPWVPVATATPWVRNSEWLTLPAITPGEHRIVGLHAIYQYSNFCAFAVEGTAGYTVDWGDGTVENYASG